MPDVRLFSSLKLRDVTLKNRIVVSPMWQYAGENGFPTDWHLMNLGRLADGGAGLVFQEGTTVERRGCGTLGDIGIWDDRFTPAMTRLASVMRDNGAVPGIQLMHAGRKARQQRPWEGRNLLERSAEIADWDAWEPIGPSALPMAEGLAPPRAMTLADIAAVTEAFASATRRAVTAGYEALELHAAHGYLLHTFLCEASNQRGDAYGGDFARRARFVLEIVEAVRAAWPQDKPLFVRLSCVDRSGWTISDTIQLTRLLIPLGVDVIDCTSGGLKGSPLSTGRPPEYGYQAAYAAELRRETGVLTAAVGLIVHAEHAERLLAEGAADLIAIGREMIYNPNWPIDAAQKLGVDDGFSLFAERAAFWLSKRAEAMPALVPSTFPSDKT